MRIFEKDGKIFLLEKLSLQQALDVFGITLGSFSSDDLKKKYRELSFKHHPDKGGSIDMMQKINLAYEVLKNIKSHSVSGGSMSREDERNKKTDEYKLKAKIALANIQARFNVNEFKKYFENIINRTLNVKVVQSDLSKVDYYTSYVFYNVLFHTDDDKTSFRINTSMSLIDINLNGGIGSGDIDFTMMIQVEVYHDRRKVKMSQKDYDWSKSKTFLSDPTKLFPKAKINKIFTASTKKFTRKDALLVFKNELKAKIQGDDIFIDLETGHYLAITRMTMMRQGYYMSNIYLYKKRENSVKIKSFSFNENEEQVSWVVEKLKKIKKIGDINKVVDEIEKMVNEFKNKYK